MFYHPIDLFVFFIPFVFGDKGRTKFFLWEEKVRSIFREQNRRTKKKGRNASSFLFCWDLLQYFNYVEGGRIGIRIRSII